MSERDLSLRVTQASLNQTALGWARNMRNIYAAIDEAVRQRSDILALEELTLTGYEVNDDFQRTDNTRILAALDDIAAYAKDLDPHLIISIGHPWRVQMRDVEGPEGAEFERVKNPLYDRLNLPFNVQSVIANGEILGMTAKANLYNDGRGYEKRYFNEFSVEAANDAGGTYGTITVPLDDTRSVPFGRPIHYVTDGTQGFYLAHAICEEKWVATRYDGYPNNDSRYESDNIVPSIARYLGGKDGLVLVIANASPPSREKNDMHVHLDKLAAQHADVVIDTDGLGSSGSTFAQFGHRLVVQDDAVLSHGDRMSFDRVSTTTTTFKIHSAAENGKQHGIIRTAFHDADAAPIGDVAYQDNAPTHGWDAPEYTDRHYEEIIRNEMLWLYDYMRKTGHRGIAEALSGGADSAFNTVLFALTVEAGMKEVGVAEFCTEMRHGRKDHYVAIEAEQGIDAAISAYLDDELTAVYMGTNNSSEQTRSAAEFLIKGGIDPHTGEVVKGIGGKFMNRNVQDLLDFYGAVYAVENTSEMDVYDKAEMVRDIATYLNLNPNVTTAEDRAELAAALKVKYPQIEQLVTAADGVSYENIQARGRQVLNMLIANMENKLAIANPNLDEARNAYATYGGDHHSGTINLNAGIPKAYQLKCMQYLFEHGLHGVVEPVRALGPILRNKPTAELQPKDADGNVTQSDEAAMQRSFEQMNAIAELRLYARIQTDNGARRLNAMEVFEACKKDTLFAGISDNNVYSMVRMDYTRWNIAQHKIHAGGIAPTFGRNVDHQTSQRTPNLSGESRDEMALLGLELLFSWAERDGNPVAEDTQYLLRRRAWQDEDFIRAFDNQVYRPTDTRSYDLKGVYQDVQAKGWDSLFGALAANDPISRIARTRNLAL